MNVLVATTSALSAAALFALSSAVQSKAVRGAPGSARQMTPGGHTGPTQGVRPLELRTTTRAVASPAWIVGAVIAAIAFGLHALALHEGNLTFVQPLLVTMVLFALPASRAVGGALVTAAEIGWASILVLALTVFFVSADPISRHGSGIDVWPAVVTSVFGVLTITGCVTLARRREAGVAAALLGAAAGVAFAGVAALVKTSTDLLSHGVGALMSGWQLYALITVGAVGIVLSQMAYRIGPLSASLPALNSVNPLASVVIGVAVFDERFRTGVVVSTVEALALAAITIATVLLSRSARA